jgi:cytochrome P450
MGSSTRTGSCGASGATAGFEFASQVLREFSTLVFRDYSLKLAAILTRAAASTAAAVDMQDLFLRLTLDSICKTGFGIEMGTLEPSLPDIPFAKAFETTNEIVSHRFMDPWWKLKRFFQVGTQATVVQSTKEVDDFAYNVIRTGRAELAAARRSQQKLLADVVQSQVHIS